jgi:hypothetical protein
MVEAFTAMASDHSTQVLSSYQSWVREAKEALQIQVAELLDMLRTDVQQPTHVIDAKAKPVWAHTLSPLRHAITHIMQQYRDIALARDSALQLADASASRVEEGKPTEVQVPQVATECATVATQATPIATPRAHASTQTVQDASTETTPEVVLAVAPPVAAVTTAIVSMATTATNTDEVSEEQGRQKEDDAEYVAFLAKAHHILEEHQTLALEVDAVRASEEKAHAAAHEWQRTSAELEAMLDSECSLVSDLRGALASLKGNMSSVQRYYAVQLALLTDQLHNVCQRCVKEEKRNAALHERCAAKEKRIGELIALAKVSSPPQRHSDTQSFHAVRGSTSSVGQSNIRAPSSFVTSPSWRHGETSARGVTTSPLSASPTTRPVLKHEQRSLSRDWSPSGLSPSPVPGVLQ